MQAQLNIQRSILTLFYTNHSGWLQAWLCKKTACSFEAAEIAQDVFVKLLSKNDVAPIDLATINEPRAYLTTVATHLLIDVKRRQKLEREYLALISHLQPETLPCPQQIKIVIDTLNEILIMLEGMPVNVYRAFMLYRLDGLSHAEIAQQLNVSPSMVKQYIARAMLHCYQIVYAKS